MKRHNPFRYSDRVRRNNAAGIVPYNPFPDMLYRIVAKHFVAGFTVASDSSITAAAPIIAWAYNKNITYMRSYCARKGWQLNAVDTTPGS